MSITQVKLFRSSASFWLQTLHKVVSLANFYCCSCPFIHVDIDDCECIIWTDHKPHLLPDSFLWYFPSLFHPSQHRNILLFYAWCHCFGIELWRMKITVQFIQFYSIKSRISKAHENFSKPMLRQCVSFYGK